MKPVFTWMPVTAIAFLITTFGTTLHALSLEDAARIDLLYQRGTQLAERDSLVAAAARFQSVLMINPKHTPSHVGLGHVHLKSGDLKKAEKAFRQALRKRENYAPALNGLGMVFRNTDKMLDWAIKYFRSAYQADRSYIEAYVNLAAVYREIGDTKELDTYEKLVKVDPEHADAWFQIGRIYTHGEAGRYRNAGKAEEAYRRQLEVNPGHFGARTFLGQLLKQSGRTDEALAMLKPVVGTTNAYQRRALLELAEVHQSARDHDLADTPLDAYIEGLEPEERAVYYDLSLVALGEDLSRFQEAAIDERQALSEAFWAGRDPAPATLANERWIEHCRRVAFAREHFGEHEFPWDARGEVYVRYGKPDHISASENIRFETQPNVLAVKDHLMNQAGEGLSHLLLSRRMINFYAGEAGMDDAKTLSTVLGYPVYPVRGLWEYWIFASVGGGVEVTFVQKYRPGPYEYAEMPHAGDPTLVDVITGKPFFGRSGKRRFNPAEDSQTKSNLIWQRMNPGLVMHRVARKTPENYEQDFATAPLDFFYDSARFKADNHSVKLEVYYGIPTRDLNYRVGADGRSVAYLKRGLALYDEADKLVYRSSEDMELYTSGSIDTTQISFVPAMDRLSVAPGTYRLSVQILDASSDKSQVYNREVVLHPYGDDSLRVSDIEMASLIRPSRGSKFTKGEIEVVPNPSLFYFAGQPVYIYYEVYSLKKDEFGRTDYRVSYELHSLNKGNVAVRILKALGRLVGVKQQAEVVTVEYDHEGDKADEYGYLELDMSKTDPGHQLLIVKVSDAIAGSQATSAVSFAIR
ncbi:MAG: tetratricopeptide repeat protein [Gemmatimonadota bacterium]|nr:tetratricopeptide repeat protein [Gemmatimonadota bacterium]